VSELEVLRKASKEQKEKLRQETEDRFNNAIEETQSLNHDSITALGEQLLEMQKRIEELEKIKGQS
jgi:TolA-binding protein